jgi:ABC-type xylose transport system permease subunit
MKSSRYSRAFQAASIIVAMTGAITAARLSLGAKVQGETGTVENKLVLKATP